MPKYWYNKFSNNPKQEITPGENESYELNIRIIADKKPYFMKYIYPKLSAIYDTYIKNTNKKCYREFRIPIEELLAKDVSDLTEREAEFIKYYHMRMPVGTNNCIMNKICKRFEDEFDQILLKNASENDFDYSIMKSNTEYSLTQYKTIQKLYDGYTKRLLDFSCISRKEKIDYELRRFKRMMLRENFVRDCEFVCSNGEQLCDIVLDICYSNNNSKQFCWDICGEEIVQNLINKNKCIAFPIKDENGDIEFKGLKFSMFCKEVI